MALIRSPLEQHTRTQINLRLQNLGWKLNERDPLCNVTQGQARTEEQQKKLKGKFPDYFLYDNSANPIGVIEAKRPGEDLDNAMYQAIERYAKPLQIPLVFAFNDTFVTAQYMPNTRPLKIDGEELQDFIDQGTALRFVVEGPEILSTPRGVNYTREKLLDIFKQTNRLLRNKEGLRAGYERLSAFSEILFLKLVDESQRLKEHRGLPRTLESRYCWSEFINKRNGSMLDFISDTVWKRLKKEYGDIFDTPFSIKNPATLEATIELINPINLTSTDTDVKGDAFEYFLKSVTNGTKDLGEYFTPRHIVRTMVHLIKPVFGETIYDPFCGTGGFLLEAFKYLSLRVDITKSDVKYTLERNTLYGREFTSTARIAKMNMVLFGDGHSNIEQIDSLEHPVKGKYDIVLSNIPYSQKTEYGPLYPIPTRKDQNADAICMQHIWESLTTKGRAAVVVPESFLYEGGVIGKTREMIARTAKKLTVVSLPRCVFMPYTPTKTNIFYFEKDETHRFKNAFFFVVDNDGFELNTKRKPVAGESDLKVLLSEYDIQRPIAARANIVSRDEINTVGNWNLRPFYYMEDVPEIEGDTLYLKDVLLKEVKDKVDPRNEPDRVWKILEVSQQGIFLGDTIFGNEATQKYKIVRAGDLVYNPYRVNIGSIGVVPTYFDRCLVSPAYVVARAKADEFPPHYILSVLKSERYLKVIMHYSISSARASLPYSELIRIKIPKPIGDEIMKLKRLQKSYDEAIETTNQKREDIIELATLRIQTDEHDAKIASKRLNELQQSPEKIIRGDILEKKMKQWVS